SGQAANRQSVELIETDLVAGNELEAVGREVLSDGSDVVLVIGVEIRIGQRQLNGFRRNQGLLQLGALNDGGSGVVGQLQLRRNAVDIDKGVDVSLRVAVVGAKHVEVRAHRHPAKLGVRLDSQLDVARLLGPVGEIGIVLRYGRIETAGLVAFARAHIHHALPAQVIVEAQSPGGSVAFRAALLEAVGIRTGPRATHHEAQLRNRAAREAPLVDVIPGVAVSGSEIESAQSR